MHPLSIKQKKMAKRLRYNHLADFSTSITLIKSFIINDLESLILIFIKQIK